MTLPPFLFLDIEKSGREDPDRVGIFVDSFLQVLNVRILLDLNG